jgi:hypothetical protein
MEEEIEIVTLEDGIDYMVLDEIKSSGVTYVYLANVDDEKDICVRKVTKVKGKEIINGLDSKTELEKALLLFAKNHQDEL